MSLNNRKEKQNWVLSILNVEGIDFKFKIFDEQIGKQNDFGKKANVYFKFPQNYDEKWGLSLDIIDIEILN